MLKKDVKTLIQEVISKGEKSLEKSSNEISENENTNESEMLTGLALIISVIFPKRISQFLLVDLFAGITLHIF